MPITQNLYGRNLNLKWNAFNVKDQQQEMFEMFGYH